MAYTKFSEIQINGEPIDWDLYRLSSFTPKQGAKLAYRIDPLKTKKSDDVKHIQAEFQDPIRRLTFRLAGISPVWTLDDLVDFLGDDAPEGMIDVVSRQPKASVGKIPVRPAQIEAICKTAGELGYKDLQAIPVTGKAAIKKECLKDAKSFTGSGFDHAWKEASKQNVISIQDKEKFLPR